MSNGKLKIIKATNLSDTFYEIEEFDEMDIVREILSAVKAKGDKAVRRYSKLYDGLSDNTSFEASRNEIDAAYDTLDGQIKQALETASKNIRMFAQKQLEMFKDLVVETPFGQLGHRVIPLNRVGCYVPGGRYPLPSSLLMTVIPAKVAGVNEVIVCSPKISPVTLAAAKIAQADRVFRVGGAQAIGAMAYGTETIPQVDKIVGPGNIFVTAAKKAVFGRVGIDFLAGPSEVIIIADKTANSKIVAADLLAQAEHDVHAKVDLLTDSEEFANRVNNELEEQLKTLPTREVAEKSVGNGFAIIVESLDEAVTIANRKAPEHLELHLEKSEDIIPKLRNYGSLFIGEKSAEVFGDYCAGPNHTLPTNGSAKYTSGLSVKDFVKFSTFQKLNDPNLLISTCSTLAETEGLIAHRNAALFRKS